jgi:hypothetical protein
MRAKKTLVLHLGGVGKYVSQIWGWYVHSWESGDLHTLATTCTMWGKLCSAGRHTYDIYRKKKKGKPARENPIDSWVSVSWG